MGKKLFVISGNYERKVIEELKLDETPNVLEPIGGMMFTYEICYLASPTLQISKFNFAQISRN